MQHLTMYSCVAVLSHALNGECIITSKLTIGSQQSSTNSLVMSCQSRSVAQFNHYDFPPILGRGKFPNTQLFVYLTTPCTLVKITHQCGVNQHSLCDKEHHKVFRAIFDHLPSYHPLSISLLSYFFSVFITFPAFSPCCLHHPLSSSSIFPPRLLVYLTKSASSIPRLYFLSCHINRFSVFLHHLFISKEK